MTTQHLTLEDWTKTASGAGYQLSDVPILLPTDTIIKMMGERMRARMFETRTTTGESLCLRPDFTLAIATGAKNGNHSLPIKVAYAGKVFRQSAGKTATERANETIQFGIEHIDTKTTQTANAAAELTREAAIFTLGFETVKGQNIALESVTLGDSDLFDAAISDLNIAPPARELIKRTARQHTSDDAFIEELQKRRDETPRYLKKYAALSGEAREEAIRSDIAETGEDTAPRTPEQIIARVNAQIALSEALNAMDRGIFEKLKQLATLKIPINSIEKTLESLSKLGRNSEQAVMALDQFLAALSDDAKGVIVFDLFFQRPFTYYQGRLYEAVCPHSAQPLWAGGRYDKLLEWVAGRSDLFAAGFALWPERMREHAKTAGGSIL